MCSAIYSLYKENLQENIHHPSLAHNNLTEMPLHRGYFHGIFQNIFIIPWEVVSDVFHYKTS